MRRLALGFFLGVVSLGRAARANGFEADGTFRFDPIAAATIDFETETLPTPADPKAPSPKRKQVADALSGGWVLAAGPFEPIGFEVALPPEPASYRASVWIRGNEATGFVGIAHDGKRIDEIAALYPSGRMTSDGWVELANERIAIDGGKGKVFVGALSPAGCELDAFELVRDGNVLGASQASCKGTSDGGACGPGQICQWGSCRRVSGWVPPIPPQRDAMTDYLGNRLKFLFGPYQQRALDMPNALVAIEQMRNAKDSWSYWNGFLLAVRRLHDGHTASGRAPIDYAIRNPKPIDVCFIEGDADWSRQIASSDAIFRDVLVSHAGNKRTLGLARGDRLVRVDGRHPIDWARSTMELDWAYTTAANHGTYAEQAAALRGLISRYASAIEVIRCDASKKTCGAIETISVLDQPPLADDESFDGVMCDNRPLRHVSGAPANHASSSDVLFGIVDASNEQERIFGVEWDSLYTTTGQDGIGAKLQAAMAGIAKQNASATILDHRRGTGGTFRGPKIVWDETVKKRPLSLYQARQRAEDEQPSLAAGKALFDAAIASSNIDLLYAGSTTATPIPVALLLTGDVSASDWLALGMKGEPNVRLFGPYATSGSFSTRYSLGYWLGMSYTLASGDTFIASGASINGTGVVPDELVLPKQSDLVQGKDTVFEAALSWIRSQQGGGP